MRILYVSHSFPVPDQPLSNVGGMQRVAVGLHAALERRGDVDLDRMVLETSWRWTGLRTPAFLARLLTQLPTRVREHRAEVVLFSSMVTASVVLVLEDRIRKAGAHTAVIPVGRDVTLPNPLYQRLVPRILEGVDTVFPISRATAQTCLTRGVPADKVEVVPCGVDLPAKPEPAQRAAARVALVEHLRQLGRPVDEDSFLLLSVGRHQERKGFHWFAQEVMSRTSPDTIYLIAGSGPMTAEISRIVETFKLEDRVFLLGRVPEDFLQQLYLGSDLFVMPNIPVEGDIEGFGVVMLEAGAAGLPVLAAELEGIRDVVTPEYNGYLVPPGRPEAYLEVIEQLQQRDDLDVLSARAADHVHGTFGWDAVAEQYVDILEGRLGGG